MPQTIAARESMALLADVRVEQGIAYRTLAEYIEGDTGFWGVPPDAEQTRLAQRSLTEFEIQRRCTG